MVFLCFSFNFCFAVNMRYSESISMDYLAAPFELNFYIKLVYYLQNFMRPSIMIPEFTGFWSLQQKDIITHLKICAVYIFVIVAIRPGFSLYKIVIH